MGASCVWFIFKSPASTSCHSRHLINVMEGRKDKRREEKEGGREARNLNWKIQFIIPLVSWLKYWYTKSAMNCMLSSAILVTARKKQTIIEWLLVSRIILRTFHSLSHYSLTLYTRYYYYLQFETIILDLRFSWYFNKLFIEVYYIVSTPVKAPDKQIEH